MKAFHDHSEGVLTLTTYWNVNLDKSCKMNDTLV